MAICSDCWWCRETGYSYWEPPETWCEKDSEAWWGEVDSLDEEIECEYFLPADEVLTYYDMKNDPDIAYDEWRDRRMEEEAK